MSYQWFSLCPHEQGLLFDKRIAELIISSCNHLITKELIVRILSEQDFISVSIAEQQFEDEIKEHFNIELLNSLYVKWVPLGALFYFQDEDIIIVNIETMTNEELDEDLFEA
jgi:hypothetical protein